MKIPLFQRLLKNNYLLFAVAVVISLVIWGYLSFSSPSTDTTFTISGVPIQMDISDEAKKLGLQIFTANEPTAAVTVSGNRTVLGLVNENDLVVTAASSSVNSPGNYTLPVAANKRSSRGNFQITNCTPSTVSVTIDYMKEANFKIQDGIIFYVEDNYYGSVSLSFNDVTVSGPQSEVAKVKKVVAKAVISSKLTSSRDVEARLVMYDENNNELSKGLMKMSIDTVTATVTVLPEKNVSVVPSFINKPEGLDVNDFLVSVSPSELLLAGSEEDLKKIDSVKTDDIDFSKIKNEKIDFDDLPINVPENCKNISNKLTAKVSLDLSSFSSKNFTVDNFAVEGLPEDYTYEVTSKSINVTVIGPKEDINKLTQKNITAVIDTSNSSGKTGSVEMPVTFRFSGVKTCWAYGTYHANVTISKKEA